MKVHCWNGGLLVSVFLCLSCDRNVPAAKAGPMPVTRMVDCAGGKLDPATNLCWQNPHFDTKRTWVDAKGHCENLALAGHTDWRLPKIGELVSLLKGCRGTTATGDLSPSQCAVEPSGCAATDTCWCCRECYGCPPGSGPGQNGRYMDPALNAATSPGTGWYWSSSAPNSLYSALTAFSVNFVVGSAGDESKRDWAGNVRCVRDGP